MPSYTIPYAPPVSQRPDGSNISRLLMRGGEIAADRAERSAQIWGGTVANLGQLLGGAVQQHQAGQAEKKLRAREGAQDQAFMQLLGSDGPIDPRAVLSIYGPEKGMKIAAGLSAFNELGAKKGEEAMKALPALITGLDAVSEPLRAQMYPAARARALQSGLFPPEALPEQYDPRVWADVSAFGKQLAGGKPPEDFTLSPGAQRRDAKGNLIAENPVVEKPGTGFDLSPGQTRFDAQGRPIASLPAAPREPRDRKGEWVLRGGKPVRIGSEAEIMPGDEPYVTPKQSLKNVTSGDAGRIADFDTSLDDLNVLRNQIGTTGASSKIGAMLPNVVSEVTGWGADAKSRQGMIDRVKQVIGKALEGGVLRKEDEVKYEKILPTIGDPPAVAKAKLEGLEAALVQRRQRLLEALDDSGFDTSKFGAYKAKQGPEKPKVEDIKKKYNVPKY